MVHRQRGFTLLEVLVAAAVFAVVSFALFGLLHEYTLTGRTLATNQHTRSDIAHLLDRLESDAGSSDSVFLPDKDVFGADNSAVPHEIDFHAKDAANRPYFWAYYYDATAKTLQRYDYANIGSTAKKDGGTYGNITRFSPSLHAISEISDASSPIYFPVLTSAKDHDVALGANANVVGGTHIIHIDMATSNESIPVDLQAGGAPSGFTVVLNYTPAPKVLALKTWPIAVKYGLNNTDVAPGCHAVAYTDTAMTVPDTVGILGHPTMTVGTQSGCFDGSVVAYDANGQSATYQLNNRNQTCSPYINPIAWSPSSRTGLQVVPSRVAVCPLFLVPLRWTTELPHR